MLTEKENLLETLKKDGHPDRYVNQHRAFALLTENPLDRRFPWPVMGETVKNGWGVTLTFPEGAPGDFPVHDDEHRVLQDITEWKKVVHAPKLDFSDDDWKSFEEEAAKVNRDQYLLTQFYCPGIFEMLHYLMGVEDCLINFYDEPEFMHELINYITDYELEIARQICEHIKPEGIYHHDDWGTQKSYFMNLDMFREFILPAYKKIYGYYKEHGVKIIIHHSDSFGEELVPMMIEMGIDIWQGCMSTNDIPSLIQKYGGQITFMGGIDNGRIDRIDWNTDKIAKEVHDVCKRNGTRFFIPCLTMGGPYSTYDGVYDAVTDEIDKLSKELF